MKCLRCGNPSCVKAGIVGNKQRYRCKSCRFHFTINNKVKPAGLKRAAIHLYLEGLSYSYIGKLLGVSDVAVYKWLKPALDVLNPLRKSEKKLLSIGSVYNLLYDNNENILFVSTFEKSVKNMDKCGFSLFLNG